jgi:hypothetical protein
MSFPIPDGEPIYMVALIRRASVRQLRLHACACMRLSASKRTRRELFQSVEIAERYADGEIGAEELQAGRDRLKGSLPSKWGGDFGFAFTPDDRLQAIWDGAVDQDRTFRPTEPDYKYAFPRYRVFEELVGPDPRPHFSPSWRTDTAVSLARTMYDSREFSAMPILADAIQDTGCDDEVILAHCRHATHPHVRGCWVLDLVLGKK